MAPLAVNICCVSKYNFVVGEKGARFVSWLFWLNTLSPGSCLIPASLQPFHNSFLRERWGTLMVAWETAISAKPFPCLQPICNKGRHKVIPRHSARLWWHFPVLFSSPTACARAPQHQHLMTQLPFLIKGDAWPRVCVFAIPPSPPLSYAQGEKCLYFPSKYYRERFNFDILYRQSIPPFRDEECILHDWEAWPGKLNRHKSCTPVSCDKPRWYQCTW